MSFISTHALKNSTIMLLYSEKDEIKVDPEYQRMGGVWTYEKKQLLMDSILNDYDLPKIYFHVLDKNSRASKKHNYAVIDGRQRLEAIWEFIEGKYSLASDFDYQRDKKIKLSGLSYNDLSKEYPRVKIQFDSFVLPVIGVETDDEELIEDMFSRLNEAVPLNSAEKRNAIGGDLVKAIRDTANLPFFKNNVSFSNRRYQHREVAARFLLIENCMLAENDLIDTKKVYLDALAIDYRTDEKKKVREMKSGVAKVIREMQKIFTENDSLLRAQGNLVVYYLLIRNAMDNNETSKVTRRKLLDFQDKLKKNRLKAERNYTKSSYKFLEYDRLTQQGTNDASNIKARLLTISKHMNLTI